MTNFGYTKAKTDALITAETTRATTAEATKASVLTGGSAFAAAMVEELPLLPPPIVTFTASTTSSFTSPHNYPAVVSAALNPVFRINLNDYIVSGSMVEGAQVAATVGSNPTGDQSQSYEIDFDCDDGSFEIDVATTSTTIASFRLWVNEQESDTFVSPTANARQYIKVVFPNGRAYRRIRLEIDGQIQFYGINTSTDGVVQASSDVSTGKIAIVGDSYAHGDGYKTTNSARSYVTTASRQLGYAQHRRYAAPGTGLVNAGAFGVYQTRAAAIIAYNPDTVIIQGSQNDNGQSGIQAALAAFITAIQTGLPNAKIIVTGVLRSYVIQAADVTTNTALQAACTAASIPFIDTSTWFTGTGSVASPNASGNSDFYNYQYVSGHPSPAGHIFLGRQIAREAARILVRPSYALPEPAGQAALAAATRGKFMSPMGGTYGGEVVGDRATLNNNGIVLTSGAIKFSPALVATRTEQIAYASIGVGGTGAAGVTFAGYAVYEVDDNNNLTLVASTANNTSSLWNLTYQSNTPSGNVNTKQAFQTPFTKIAGRRYAVGLLFVGTTAPTVFGVGQVSVDAPSALVPPFVGATITGQTGFPATIAGTALTGLATVPMPLLTAS